MQIQFDPRDPSQLATVARIVAALQGGASIVPYDRAGGPDIVTVGTIYDNAGAPAATADDDPADNFAAAEAFGDTPDAATAFAGNGTGASAATLASSAPVTTPASGTTAPPPTSDNGPTATTAAFPSSGVDVDAKGLPWDARIHSGPTDKKPKNSDGTWRRKRNTDDAVVAQVEAELRQVMGAGNVPTAPAAPDATTPPAPPPSVAAVSDTSSTDAPVSAAPPAPPVPAAPVPTAAPAAPVPTPPVAATETGPAAATTAVEMTFPQLMRQITALQSAGTLTIAGTNEIAQALGLTGVRDLVHRPDLVAPFAALLPEPAVAG